MSILVAYASRHASAGQIAERIADGLMAAGNPANAPSHQEEADLADSSCLVFGSVAHSTHWLREARVFARRNRDLLATTSAPMTCVRAKKTINEMMPQRNAAHAELQTFRARGPSQVQITAGNKRPEDGGRDIFAVKATAKREANTPARFGHVTCAGGLLRISNSRLATR